MGKRIMTEDEIKICDAFVDFMRPLPTEEKVGLLKIVIKQTIPTLHTATGILELVKLDLTLEQVDPRMLIPLWKENIIRLNKAER